MKERADREGQRADQAERDPDAARQEREDARVRAAAAEGEAKALRDTQGEARRPFWHRWLGVPPS